MRHRTSNPLQELRREMDRLFSTFMEAAGEPPWPFTARERLPVNIWEDNEAVYVEAELPGVKPDQVDISVAGNELTIKVNRPAPEEKDVVYHRRERATGKVSRVLRLPCDVDADKVEAELRWGVLTVKLPKAESARPRKIQVTTS